MAYAVRPSDFQRDLAAHRAPAATAKPRTSLLSRFFDSLFVSRQRQAQRDIEGYLARTGYRLTDSIEREMSERLVNGGWNSRR